MEHQPTLHMLDHSHGKHLPTEHDSSVTRMDQWNAPDDPVDTRSSSKSFDGEGILRECLLVDRRDAMDDVTALHEVGGAEERARAVGEMEIGVERRPRGAECGRVTERR